MTETPPRKHPLHESIDKHKIRRVAVVDDAFDAVSLESFQEGEDQEFLIAVNEHDSLLREFHKLVSVNESEELLKKADLTDQVVKLLWEKGKELPGLGPILKRTLFRVLDLKVSQVARLCAFLKDELHIESIETYGTKAEMPDGEFDLAFVDYRFGPSRQQESVHRAVRWATHLYHKGKTFIILMSAEAEASGRQEPFRRESKLTRGLFEFLDKKEIDDASKFCNRLNSFCAGLDTRHEVHKFASAAETAVDEAITALKEAIHALGLEDYAYLEQISLREDGHPLGDYLVWLFGEYFAHNLAMNDSLQPARKNVNGLKYERFLPLQRPPSVMLAKMYSAAITEPVHEGWGPHPRDAQQEGEETGAAPDSQTVAVSPAPETAPSSPAPVPPPGDATPADTPASGIAPGAGAPPAPDVTDAQATAEAPASAKGMPLYQLGDLLVADKDKPAFLLLNAGCDLQFSPGERDCDINQSILLIPGRFEPLHERGPETNVKRTELFELGGERFRIIWQHTRVIALPYYQVLPEHQPKGYERKWRLKLPYALEVQQHFAAQLTRVGVPTPTPVFRERPVEVYGKDANGECRHLGTIKNGILVFHHLQRDQFVLTVDCVNEVLDQIDRFASTVAEELRADPGTPPPTGDAAKRAGRRRKYLDELRESRATLAHACTFQDKLSDLPAVNGVLSQIEEISTTNKPVRLEIRHAVTLTGRFPGNAPIMLVFSLPDIAAEALPAELEASPAAMDARPAGAINEEIKPS